MKGNPNPSFQFGQIRKLSDLSAFRLLVFLPKVKFFTKA